MIVDIASVRSNVQQRHIPAQSSEKQRSNRRRSTIRAIQNNPAFAEIQSSYSSQQRSDILVRIVRQILNRRHRRGVWRSRGNRMFEDNLLNRQLRLIRQLLPIRTKQLDAVVLPRIVTR